MRIFFSDQMLSIAIGTAVLFPFVALAFASVHINYATRDGIRKTVNGATQTAMEIRPITRADAPELLEILRAAGPHGHREWPTDDETSFMATLENPRLDPDLGGWSIAYDADSAVGYVLAEPELNIGRVLVGLAATSGNERTLGPLLVHGVKKAKVMADRSEFEVHVAVRDSEPSVNNEVLNAADFHVVRTVLKMQVGVSDVELKPSSVPDGSIVRDAMMTDSEEAEAVTNLHNACFTGSWGFSPNTVEEIVGRTASDAERNGFAPIVVMENGDDGALTAYNWITLDEGDGRVEMVGVHPAVRGTGLGWAIFNAGVERLIQNGATRLVLDVDSENPPARRIYESAGYRTYSEVRYYGLEIVKD